MCWLMAHVTYKGKACLIFPFYKDTETGYGRLGHEGEILYAHRVMCKAVKGPPPSPKHEAAHSCGSGHLGCVHPDHLSWKLKSGNQLDRTKHGRHRGAKGNRARLTPEQIAEIRAKKGIESQMSLAKRFKVKRGCITYWHGHNRPPVPHAMSPSAIRRRALGITKPIPS